MARVSGLLGWISDKASDAYDWYKEQDTPLSAYLRGDSVADATSRSLDEFGENLSNPEYAMDWVSPLGIVGSIARKTAPKAMKITDFPNRPSKKEIDEAINLLHPHQDAAKIAELKDNLVPARQQELVDMILEKPKHPKGFESYFDEIEVPFVDDKLPIIKPEVKVNTTPATNSFFENIRLAEDDMMKYANDIDFTHNNKAYTKGGPISQLPGGAPYEMPTYAQRYSDELFGNSFVNPNNRQGYVHSRLNNAERHGSFAPRHDVQKIKEGQDVADMLWYSDTHYQPNRPGYAPEGTFITKDKKKLGTYFHKPSYVTDGLTDNRIRNMQSVEPRNLTVDETFTRGTVDNTGKSTIGDFYQELYNTKAGNYPESIRRNYMFDEVNKIKSPDNMFDQIENAGYFPREAGRGKVDIDYDLKATPQELKQAYPSGRLDDNYIDNMEWSSFDKNTGEWLDTTSSKMDDFKPSGSRVGNIEPVTLDQNALKRMSPAVRKKLEGSIEQVDNILSRNTNRKPGYLEEDLLQLTNVLDNLSVEKSTKSVEDVRRYVEQAYKKLLMDSDSRSINMIRPERFNDEVMTQQGLLDISGEKTIYDDIAGDVDDLDDFLRDLRDGRASDNIIE